MSLESAIADQTAAVTALTMAVNNKMEAIDLLVANKVSSLGSGTFKNKLINGNFDIWQRGISKDWTINGGYGSADRWCFGSGMGPATVSFSQTPGPIEKVPSARYGLRVQIKNPDVSAPTPWLKQNIESVASFAGCKVTLSFYMRADVARTINLVLLQVFGSGGVTSESSATEIPPIQITSEWKKYSATFDLPAVVGKKIGSNGDDRLEVCFNFPVAASTYFIDIAQVQMEEGGIATAFEPRPIGLEMLLCQRYFQKISFGSEQGILAYTSESSVHGDTKIHAVPMRTAPAASFSTPISRVGSMSGISVGAVTNSFASSNGIRWFMKFSGTSLASAQTYPLSGTTLSFDAEL